MCIFTVLITVTVMAIVSMFVFVFRYGYSALSQVYLKDVNRQTTNNLETNIQKIEDISLQILSSQTVQKQLRIVNQAQEMDTNVLRRCTSMIERELSMDALYADYVVSVSVISLTGIEFSVKKVETGGTQFYFTEEEIYEARGSNLWALTGNRNRICIARAILDLDTMKPIGYINIVYENSFFGDILTDVPTEYSGASYVVDDAGMIVVSNVEEHLGMVFPMDVEELGNSHEVRYDMLNSTQAFYYVGSRMQNGWLLLQTVSVREFYKNLNHQVYISAGLVLIVLAVSYFLNWVATLRIVKPTQELLESMKALGKDDRYPRVQVVTSDEIGMIGMEYNKMAENIETLIEKVYKMELTQKQAEIEFLQMQINPHFLYNALDTISWMALEKGNQEISEMVIALAELLRATIQKEGFITLREEMNTVKDYLLIQEERFGDKISVVYDIEKRTEECLVPNFILQPLIENAIIHGLEPKLGKGQLHISIFIQNNQLYFEIEDDGAGMEQEEIQNLYEQCRENSTNKAIGLKNVYRRLLLCYGENSLLKITGGKGEGTKICFSIPVKKQ